MFLFENFCTVFTDDNYGYVNEFLNVSFLSDNLKSLGGVAFKIIKLTNTKFQVPRIKNSIKKIRDEVFNL